MNRFWVTLLLTGFCVSSAFSQTINVDASNIIKSFDSNPVGINLDYLMDDDSYLKPSTSLSQSILNMKIGMLRYPGGEKSDNYQWSVFSLHECNHSNPSMTHRAQSYLSSN